LDLAPESFITMTNSATILNKWLKTDRHLSTFEIKTIEHSSDPLEVLRVCFKKAIEDAIAHSREHTGEPDKLGIGIHSDLLLKGPLWIPIHKIGPIEDTVEQIVRRLEKMSYPEDNERAPLFSAPFKVDITTICQKKLQLAVEAGKRRSTMNGKGRRRINKDLPLCFFEKGIIRIQNTEDPYCLFYALEVARLQSTMSNRRQFHRYRSSPERQYEQVRLLMEAAGIPTDLTEYDAFHFLPIVQQYFDQQYPQQFRIYVFNAVGKYKPSIKTGDIENANPLVLWYSDQHFDVVSSIRNLFDAPYCWSCESTYR
jgi:hypothetical protein